MSIILLCYKNLIRPLPKCLTTNKIFQQINKIDLKHNIPNKSCMLTIITELTKIHSVI